MPPPKSRAKNRGFRPLAEPAGAVLDPVLRRRAGIMVDLLHSWEEIARPELAQISRPLRIAWPRRAHDNDPFTPGTLTVACEGFAAMRLQHEAGEICDRVNAFFGFAAIARIRIEQKPVVSRVRSKRSTAVVCPEVEQRLRTVTGDIEDDGLREALQRLGRSIAASRKGS